MLINSHLPSFLILENSILGPYISIRRIIGTFFLSIWLSGNALCLQAQDNKIEKQTLFELLESGREVTVSLEMDIDSVVAYKLKEREFNGEFVAMSSMDTMISLDLKISARGKFRRKECGFPPLRLNFVKGRLRELNLEDSDKYKLVTHCLDDETNTKYLIREYLSYGLYNILTERSFRALMFPITYYDLGSDASVETLAFLLESNNELPKRLNGDWSDDHSPVHLDSLDPFHLEMACLFHYMVGNRDMNIYTKHNMRYLDVEGDEQWYAVPYDFDFSYLVSAPYAFKKTNPMHMRAYLGFEQNQEEMMAVFDRFLKVRKELLAYVDSFPLMNKKERRRTKYVIDSFYKDLRRRRYKLDYTQ